MVVEPLEDLESNKNGKFRFTEARHDEDMIFGTPNSTTVVGCDGKTLTKYTSNIDAWGEGSTGVSSLTSQGGVKEYTEGLIAL